MTKLEVTIYVLTALLIGVVIGNYITSKNLKYVNAIQTKNIHMHYLAIHKNDSVNFTYIFGKQDDEFYKQYMP
jgi:uncharacterized protein YneF (UPF0154 family)